MKEKELLKILDMPFYQVTGMKYSCEPMGFIANYFLITKLGKEDYESPEEAITLAKSIKVSDVMGFTPKTIKKIITKCDLESLDGSMEFSKRKIFRKALQKAQQKLRKFGLSQYQGRIGGPFMDIVFYPKDNIEDMATYIYQNTYPTPCSHCCSEFMSLAKKLHIKVTPELIRE